MKRTLLLVVGVLFAFVAAAQPATVATEWKAPEVPQALKKAHVEIPYRDYKMGTEVPTLDQIQNASNYQNAQRAVNETTIGTTRYDLQTNAAIQRRIINHGNGDISAAWTYSNQNDWSTRGTGYNFYDGSAWGAQPTSEIESERVGWPNLGTTGTDEFVYAHSTASDVIRRSERNSIGSGTWSQMNLTPLDIQVWSRLAIGGSNNQTIHLIGLTLPVALDGGAIYQGVDGALLYNRSQDGGATWDISNVFLPEGDSAFYSGYGGDSYSIDARGNTVVIAYGEIGAGCVLWKSTDNGTNWTKHEIITPRFFRFDENIHTIPADFDSADVGPDGTMHVILDANDNAHVFFGYMPYTNETAGDGLLGFFPGTNGIMYWNETWGDRDPQIIAGAIDHDGDGALNIPDNTWLASYRFSGLAGYPSAGWDSNGDLYLVFPAVHELHDNLSQKYRHIYACKSEDNGCSWTAPVDLTADPAHDFDECMYPSLAYDVDSKLHLVYQRDFEPGIAVAGDEDPVSTNDIIYLNADVADLGNTPDFCASGILASGGTTFCPGDSILLEGFCGSAYSWSGPNGFSASTQTISATAFGQYVLSTTTLCGVQNDTIELNAPLGGPSITITSTNGTELCPGDTTTLIATSSNPGSSSYLWSTGATASSTLISNNGTYTVTVTDCGGSSVQTVVVTPPGPPQTQITGPNTICPGDMYTLTITPVPGGTYFWFNGATTNTITLTDTIGLFTASVSNCGGNSTVQFGVAFEPAPSASITASGALEFCEGDNVTLTAGGGSTYAWSGPNAFTSSATSIVIDQIAQSGDYFLTATNDCGDDDTTPNATTVTVNANPAVPSISWDGTQFTSSASSGNQWFLNGVLQAGEIQQTFTPPIDPQGQLIAVTVTDANGCTAETSVVSVDEVPTQSTTFSVYPNPNDGQFTLTFANLATDNYDIEVRNLLGQIVYSESTKVTSSQYPLNLTDLDKGVYMLTVRQGSFENTTKVVLK